MKCRFLQKLSLQSYETSINQKATIRTTPRTLKTSKDYHRCQFLALNFEKKFKKKDFKTVFISGANLKSILCQNKSKPIPNSDPGVYTLNCSCNAQYIGETKKKVITRTIEHQQDSIKGKCESSGATEHCLKCHGQFNWLNPKTSREARYKSRKIRESLEIKRSKCNSSKSHIKYDVGNFVKRNT